MSLATIKNLRWYIAGLLCLASALNYLDRQTLSVLIGTIKDELHLTNASYGSINAWFLVSYGVMYAVSGRVIDVIGTRRGFMVFVAGWSVANMLHMFAGTVGQFSFFRLLLGVFEPGSFTGGVRAVSEWFPVQDRALGQVQRIGRILDHLDCATGTGGEFPRIRHRQSGTFHSPFQSTSRPAMIIMRTTVFLKHAVSGDQQTSAGPENARAFRQVRRGVGDMFEDLRGKHRIVGPSGFARESVGRKQTIHRRSGRDVGADITGDAGEQRAVRGTPAAVVEERSRNDSGETSDDGTQVDKAEIIRFRQARSQPAREVGVGMNHLRELFRRRDRCRGFVGVRSHRLNRRACVDSGRLMTS